MVDQYATNINAIGIGFIVFMGILVIILPRRFAPLPIFMCACFMTFGQRISIAGLNLYVLRILIFVGWVRLILHKEIFSIKLHTIDGAIVLWIISNVIIYTLLRQSSEALINRLGYAFNVIGLYFLFRSLIQDFSDIDRIFKFVGILMVGLASIMLTEYFTQRNLFSIFGGVPEVTQIRSGRLRCQGPFLTPILAGTFGATSIPLSVILWFKRNHTRLLAMAVFTSATIITFVSGSMGPIMTYVVAICGLFMWHYRKHMKAIRWGALVAVLALHFLFMKAPVWFLFARISTYVGFGHGEHRSVLIHQAIKHFDEWWLLGTDYTVHWTGRAISVDPNMADITNEYIMQGVDGGLLTMILFIIVIVLCFRAVGRALRSEKNKALTERIRLWSMGTMLFAHAVTFIAVPYFDQMIVFWYLLLAMIPIVTDLSKISPDRAENSMPHPQRA